MELGGAGGSPVIFLAAVLRVCGGWRRRWRSRGRGGEEERTARGEEEERRRGGEDSRRRGGEDSRRRGGGGGAGGSEERRQQDQRRGDECEGSDGFHQKERRFKEPWDMDKERKTTQSQRDRDRRTG